MFLHVRDGGSQGKISKTVYKMPGLDEVKERTER